MARRILPGVVHHVIARFVDRRWFFESDVERAAYLRMFAHALGESDWRCLAFALMSNHVHLQLLAGHAPLGTIFKATHSVFARWMNERRGRLGPVFAERPKAFAFQPHNEGLLTAYIHRNPVRAGVVARARESTWTSHRAYVGLDAPPPCLDVSLGMRRLGFEDPEAFDAWIDAAVGEQRDVEIEKQRRQLRRRGALEAGTPTVAGAKLAIPVMVRDQAWIRPDPRRLIEIACELTHVSIEHVCSDRRHPVVVVTRCICAKAAAVLGIGQGALANAMGISGTGVAYLGARGLDEDARAVMDIVVERMRLEAWGAVIA